MRLLWIVNIVMPELAEYLDIPIAASGSWLIDIADGIANSSSNSLAIACVYGEKYKKYILGNKIYYTLPGNGKTMLFYTKSLEEQWKKIIEDFKPDLIHIHGTEYSHGLACMRAIPNIPYIISIQGILNKIKEVDFAEIPLKYFIFGRTLKQFLHMNGEIETHILNCKNAKYEREMFKRANAINGVSTWDISIAKSFNSKLLTYKLDYNLRELFYKSSKWDINGVKRYTIFTNPGGVPLKGLHNLIKAAVLLISKYPNLLIKVPGMVGKKGNVRISSAYTRFLNRLIKKYNMEKHIVFLGKQSEKEMIENMLNSHVTVIPSAIEGASLILHEAMFLGAPCIATFRGGMADFVSDKKDGYLYDYSEYTYLAERLNQLFTDDKLCMQISKNAIKKCEVAHERKKNIKSYINMYSEVKNSFTRS